MLHIVITLMYVCIIYLHCNPGSRERNWSGGKTDKPRTYSTNSANSDATPVLTKAGGLSFTGRLSDFSLYIFHPYGGAQRKMASPMYSPNDSHKLGTVVKCYRVMGVF